MTGDTCGRMAITATVTCIWCSHTEAGEGYAPHDQMITHQAATHGHRRMSCGCHYVQNEGSSVFNWWTCDEHSVAMIRQITSWQIANYAARRWAIDPEQPSLFASNR